MFQLLIVPHSRLKSSCTVILIWLIGIVVVGCNTAANPTNNPVTDPSTVQPATQTQIAATKTSTATATITNTPTPSVTPSVTPIPPGGGRIYYYAQGEAEDTNFYTVNADNTAQTLIAFFQDDAGPIGFSPDQSKLLYWMARDLYVMNLDGTNQIQLVDSQEGSA